METRYLELVRDWAQRIGVELDTISFYQDMSGMCPDSVFTYCDITNEYTDCGYCMARLKNGDIFEFVAADKLIGAELGKLAGAI